MSLTESLPHLFRKRTLQRKLELLAQADEIVGAGTLPIAEDEERCLNSGRDSFTEGSVLFGEDILYEDDLTSPRRPLLLNASIDIRQEGHPSSNGAGLGDGGDYLKRSYFPSEPGLPDKNKDVRWVRVLASCVCLSSNGVQYSLSQFMPYVNAELGKNCMASAISLLICFFTFGCIFQGVFLAKYMSSPRASVLVTSPLVFALVLSAVALKMRMPWLIQASFALTGFGIGPSYLSAIIHLQFWLPQSPALASSIAMAFGGFGSVMMAMGIEFLVHNYGTSASFVMLALTLFGLQVGGGLFLQMPDLSHSHAKDLLVSHRSKMDASVRFTKSKDTDAFKSGLGIELRAREILKSREFMLFWLATFTAVGPGYALFANLAMIFRKHLHMSPHNTSLWVVLVNLIATLVGRLPTGTLADKWNLSKRKLFGSGCRSMFILYHCIQTIALVVIAFFEKKNKVLSVFLIIVLTCIFGGCNVLVAALSRELFAPINSSAVYGLILTATASSSLVFPNAMPSLYNHTGSDFVYNLAAAGLSFVGIVSCMLMQPLPQAYGISNSLLKANL
jgi:MFS family permease